MFQLISHNIIIALHFGALFFCPKSNNDHLGRFLHPSRRDQLHQQPLFFDRNPGRSSIPRMNSEGRGIRYDSLHPTYGYENIEEYIPAINLLILQLCCFTSNSPQMALLKSVKLLQRHKKDKQNYFFGFD